MKRNRNTFLVTMCASMACFICSGCFSKIISKLEDLNPFGKIADGIDEIVDDIGGGESKTYTIDTGYRGDYYNTIDYNSSTLKQDLHNLIIKNLCKTSYSSIWDYILYSDAANPDSSSDRSVVGYYRGTSGSKSSMNKEHVWPKSHGGNLSEGDPHMVRPTFTDDNGDRGNEFFVENGNGKQNQGFDPANYGKEQYRGDAARIVFYCAIRNTNLTFTESKYHETTNDNRDNMMGVLSTLLKWNIKYPVSEQEKLRNDVLSGVRKSHGVSFNFNRNPFIDHPDYAIKIWGNTNAQTKEVCKDYL